jgi:outer membrane protein OmpA-like peptidoglycan-associated protein
VPTDATFLTFDLSVDLPENTKQHTNYTALYEGEDEEENVSIDMIGNKFRSGKKAVVNNIYFDYRSYHLVETSVPVLEEIRTTLTKYPSLKIEIAGHTDNTGNDAANLLLSQKRAEAVRTYLVEHGVDRDRLIAKGYGAKLPLASNDDEKDGRELNRRIEIVALEKGNLDRAVIVSSKEE